MYIYVYVYVYIYIYQLSKNQKSILTQDGSLVSSIIIKIENTLRKRQNCDRQVVPKSKNVVVALLEIIVTSKIPVGFNK